MKVETKTPWVEVENPTYDFFHPEYVPAIAKVADRYGIAVRSYANGEKHDWIPPLNEGDRRILLTMADSNRMLDLTPLQGVEYLYEVVLFANYPG
jgi:hypothetical protein